MAEAQTESAQTESVHTEKSRSDKKCSVEGCKRPYRAKEYCNVHYRLWRHAELPKSRYKTCTKEGCHKRRALPGSFCEEHKSGAAT
jgi:hypothetical protein